MTPREIASSVSLGDLKEGQKPKQLLAQKQRENVKSGLDESVARHGIQKPMNIYHEGESAELHDGHHRLAAGLKHAPDTLVPVHHTDEKEGWWTLPADQDSDWAIRKGVNERPK